MGELRVLIQPNTNRNKLMKLPLLKVSNVARATRRALQANRFLALYGKGGTGKTTITKSVILPAVAEHHGVGAEDVTYHELNFSGSLPSDAKGAAMPVIAEKQMVFFKPQGWPLYSEVGDSPAVVVLDELLEWDDALQSLIRSCYPASGGRPRIGQHDLSANTFFVITGNRRSDGSRSSIPSAPFVSRTSAYALEPDVADWIDWATNEEGVMDSPLLAFLNWSDNYEKKSGSHFCPDTPKPWDGSPHPCPRQWEAAARLVQSAEDALAERELYTADLFSIVGEPAANAAMAFLTIVVKMMPKVLALRTDPRTMSSLTITEQYSVIHIAVRIAAKEIQEDSDIHQGKADWYVNLLLNTTGELKRYGYESALHLGIPLEQHGNISELSGLAY